MSDIPNQEGYDLPTVLWRMQRPDGMMSHAVAHVRTLGPQLGPGAVILVNLSGRGDKDVHTMEKHVADR